MTFNPDIHHRRSIRLQHYDYSQAGAYFVTICAQNRDCLFGHVIDGHMALNDPGQMVKKWWRNLEHKFPSTDLDAYTIMPNHFHGIIVVGAAPRGRPDVPTPQTNGESHVVDPASLGEIVGWFKTMSTNDYIHGVKHLQWRAFPGKLWQRNYYEHIIRNEDDLYKIREYIINNPAGWEKDEENPDAARP